jgi:hypothetical protein
VSDFYRTIVIKIVEDAKSFSVMQFLSETFTLHNLDISRIQKNLVSDGGSENKGDVLLWVNDQENTISHIANTPNFDFSNNEIESYFHLFKNVFAKGKVFQNSKDLNLVLQAFRDWVNNKRYPGSLFGILPSEVLAGILPNKHKFEAEIKASKLARPIANKKIANCVLCS